jgi:dTMP kinase
LTKQNEILNASIRYPANTRAKLIAIEGPDGAGKTTACELLAATLSTEHRELRGRTIFTHQPGTVLGPYVKKIVTEGKTTAVEEATMFAALQTMVWFECVQPPSDKFFVTDRYSMSTFCYQSARHDGELNDILRIVQTVPHPDLTIVLSPDFETCQQRIAQRGHGNNFDRDVELQRKVHRLYEFTVTAPAGVFGDVVYCLTADEAVEHFLRYVQSVA